jgi:hypothetical protein
VNGNTITFSEVVSEFLRKCPWAISDYTEEDIMRSIESVIKLAGTQDDFAQGVALVEINNSQGTIPKEAYIIKSCAATNALTIEEAESLMKCKELILHPIKWNMDDFNRTINKNTKHFNSKFKVILSNGKILPNFEKGVIALSYSMLMKNDNNELLIPNNQSWLLAVIWEAAFDIATRMYITDKITNDKLARIEWNKCKYVSQAGTSSRMGNRMERESIKNNNLSNPKDYFPENSFYANLGDTFTIKFI